MAFAKTDYASGLPNLGTKGLVDLVKRRQSNSIGQLLLDAGMEDAEVSTETLDAVVSAFQLIAFAKLGQNRVVEVSEEQKKGWKAALRTFLTFQSTRIGERAAPTIPVEEGEIDEAGKLLDAYTYTHHVDLQAHTAESAFGADTSGNEKEWVPSKTPRRFDQSMPIPKGKHVPGTWAPPTEATVISAPDRTLRMRFGY